ncbi:MAG: LptF/LptG family permease [Sedimentisphaerales bacterium]|nr:LptF/LptG family permease [Sedimentisphaerales bacterium]
MIFTLQRYIFRDLFKIFVLTTIGLTLILSLGGILRPVQEYGVGLRQVVHILVYFMPVTLTFVLPIAALFASALAYGRFASDNELDACRASGIGISTLVYPGLILAILVAIANLLLGFHVMPYFFRLAERSLKADAKQILFRNIQRHGYYALPPKDQYLIYADHADPKTDTLYGIIVMESSLRGFKRIITCESARVSFNPRGRSNEVRLATRNTRQLGGPGDTWWVENEAASIRQEFGSLLGDDIKFKKIDEMKQIRVNPMLFDPVAEAAHNAYVRLVAELLVQDIRAKLSTAPSASYDLSGESGTMSFSAAGCTLADEPTISLQPPVTVEERGNTADKPPRRLRCQKAVLHLDDSMGDVQLYLLLSNAKVVETGQSVVHHAIAGLALPESIREALGPSGEANLELETGRSNSLLKGPPSPRLVQLQGIVNRQIHDTLIDITGEIHSRLVFGIGCVPMILIGIALGILKRGGHLLSAFGASCVPGAVLVVAIISGKQVAGNTRWGEATPGVLIMWSGLVFLLLLTAFLYTRLVRH